MATSSMTSPIPRGLAGGRLRSTGLSTGAGGSPIVQVNDASEALLAGELEGNAEVRRQPRIAAAEDDRMDERVKLVDEVCGDHRRREARATDGEVAFARRLEPANL